MTFDTQRARVVILGGRDASGIPLSDMMEWTGNDWISLATLGAWGTQGHAMTFDSQRGRTVVVDPTGDTSALSFPAVALPFGNGCGSPPLSIQPVAGSGPTLNMTASASIENAPTPLTFVAVGWSNQYFGAFALPVSLVSIGMPGCELLQSTEIVGAFAPSTGPTTAAFSLPIPNVGGLIGAHVYGQAWAFAPGANPANIVISNGLDWRIGN